MWLWKWDREGFWQGLLKQILPKDYPCKVYTANTLKNLELAIQEIKLTVITPQFSPLRASSPTFEKGGGQRNLRRQSC